MLDGRAGRNEVGWHLDARRLRADVSSATVHMFIIDPDHVVECSRNRRILGCHGGLASLFGCESGPPAFIQLCETFCTSSRPLLATGSAASPRARSKSSRELTEALRRQIFPGCARLFTIDEASVARAGLDDVM